MYENPLVFPPKDAINQWNDLRSLPIVDRNPRSSSTSVFVHLPSESYYNHQIFANTNLSASKEIKTIQKIANVIKEADEYISKLFTRRSISKALLPDVDRSETAPAKETAEQKDQRMKRLEMVRNATKPLFDDLNNLLTSTKKFSSDAVHLLFDVLSDFNTWEFGYTSDVLVQYFCRLFYRLATLDEMHMTKSSLVNDYTNLATYANSGLQENKQQFQEMKLWLSSLYSIENELLQLLSSIKPQFSKLLTTQSHIHILNLTPKSIFVLKCD